LRIIGVYGYTLVKGDIANLSQLKSKMKAINFQTASSQAIAIERADRWTVYRRLQELDIPCTCQCDRPLQVEITSPLAAVQLWSAVKQVVESRSELVDWLKVCWKKV
jgi:hypothetical protein